MITVRFFARVREQLGCEILELAFSDAIADLDALQDSLCTERGPQWRDVLERENMIRAVNQSVINDSCTLEDGDEVAFFPPVTGG